MASTDRAALVALYEATGGASWKMKTNWNTDKELADWHGIKVNDEGRVVKLILPDNNLEGNIPKELCSLTELELIDLNKNRLTGSIPKEFRRLGGLCILDLSFNNLSGVIPRELGSLTRLEKLLLSNNRLGGSIPHELGKLRRLRKLSVAFNKLTGHIPVQLGSLTQLDELLLSNNNLIGPIPKPLGKLSELRWLALQLNELSGNIPEELGDLRKLEVLKLHGNTVVGAIPPELKKLKGLKYFLPTGAQRDGFSSSLCRSSWPTRPTSPADNERWSSRPGNANRVEILRSVDPKSPGVHECGGVRLTVPEKSLSNSIGPITVKETTLAMASPVDDTVWVVQQEVHCLPANEKFSKPLTLDFAVRDGIVRWKDKSSVRKEILDECQVLFKQDEHDTWEKMESKDVSVVFNVDGYTCLRASIKHFSFFCWATSVTSARTTVLSYHREKLVLVANSTDFVAHVTVLSTSFTTVEGRRQEAGINVSEVGFNLAHERTTEQTRLPTPEDAQFLLPGDLADFSLPDGAKSVKVIVCFFPDRLKEPSSQEPPSHPSTHRPSPARSASASSEPPAEQKSARDLAVGCLTEASPQEPGRDSAPPHNEGSAGNDDPPAATERMEHFLTKTMRRGTKLTLLKRPDGLYCKTVTKNEKSPQVCAIEMASL